MPSITVAHCSWPDRLVPIRRSRRSRRRVHAQRRLKSALAECSVSDIASDTDASHRLRHLRSPGFQSTADHADRIETLAAPGCNAQLSARNRAPAHCHSSVRSSRTRPLFTVHAHAPSRRARRPHRALPAPRHPRRAHQRAQLHDRLIERPGTLPRARDDRGRRLPYRRPCSRAPQPRMKGPAKHPRHVGVHRRRGALVGEARHRPGRVASDAR